MNYSDQSEPLHESGGGVNFERKKLTWEAHDLGEEVLTNVGGDNTPEQGTERNPKGYDGPALLDALLWAKEDMNKGNSRGTF